MGLARNVPILVLAGCFSEPSYEGRLCNETSPCPADLSCVQDRCQLLVPGDASTFEDASQLADAAGPVRDVGAMDARPDAGTPGDADPMDAQDPADADPIDAMPDAGDGLCVPGEARPCYTGPGGTSGVGICHDGTQTCIGPDFGPCENEQLPDLEICNSIDDDCDRVVDDGCPSGAVSFVQPFDTALTGWLPFGDTWQAEGCAPDQVVVGFFGHYADYLNEVGEHCDTPVVVTDASVVPHTYSLVLTPAPSAVPRGGAMGTVYNGICPAGTMVVEISGRSGSWIDHLSFTCAEFELIDTGVGPARAFSIREVAGSRTLVGLQAGGAGGAAFSLPCPTDLASTVRLRGALGSVKCCPLLVTTLGLGCSELDVSLR